MSPIACSVRMRGIATARATSATARPARKSAPRRNRIMCVPLSDLDVDDSLDHEGDRPDHHAAECEGYPTERVRVERLHVGRVDRRDEDEKPDRQERDDPARHRAPWAEPLPQPAGEAGPAARLRAPGGA